MKPRTARSLSYLTKTLMICTALWASTSQAALLIYLPLDETSGGTATDAATGNGAQNLSSGASSADWQATGGMIGGALRFSPTSQEDVDESMVYTSATPIIAGYPISISYWFRTTDSTSRSHAAVYLGNPTTSDQYFAVGSAGANSQMVARYGTAISTAQGPAINNNAWHQITAVFTANNQRLLYLDGKLLTSSAVDMGQYPSTLRFSIGALNRSNPTDAYSGSLDEVGLFDTELTAANVALLNAFPRYDAVRLDDPDYDSALAIFATQTGSVNTGSWIWSYATGLSGNLGSTGLVGGNPYVVLDGAGNGLRAVAVPEPRIAALILLGFAALIYRRRR